MLLPIYQWRKLISIVVCAIFVSGAAWAEDFLDIRVSEQDGYGRMVLDFSERLDLPAYEVSAENNVLAVVFEEPVRSILPDIAGNLPSFVTVARTDPDDRALRFGLLRDFRVNTQVAGEKLYIDLLPADWQGLPPGLPPEVVAELARRSQDAAKIAEQRRIIEQARLQQPKGTLTVGHNPSFVRLTFDWSQDTEVEYERVADAANLRFSWPSEIDFYPLLANMPAEITDAANMLEIDGNRVSITLAEDVSVRFYDEGARKFILDVDRKDLEFAPPTAEALLDASIAERALLQLENEDGFSRGQETLESPLPVPEASIATLTPVLSRTGDSTRMVFSFQEETPAALFRRGSMLWMVFDTTAILNAPDEPEILNGVASDYSVVAAGDTQIVRMQMENDQQVSLGAQGTVWVLSIGKLLVAPNEPIEFNRRDTAEGQDILAAKVGDPARLHVVRDPEVGDMLNIVTMFPPAQGLYRNLSFVDFDALPSVHGMVLRPKNPDLDVQLTRHEALLSAPNGLTLSPVLLARSRGIRGIGDDRSSFVNLLELQESNPSRLRSALATLALEAARAEGRAQEMARLDLANTYLANEMAFEALGVLNVAIHLNKIDDLRDEFVMARAAANVAALRMSEALDVLASDKFVNQTDAIMWRSIARSHLKDFAGSHADALAAEGVIDVYPIWVQQRFLLSAMEAAIEVEDFELSRRLAEKLTQSSVEGEVRSYITLLEGRLDEMESRFDEALDTYGQVIAADYRPTRAEAIYRTIALLKKMGRLDSEKGANILLAETIAWRGGQLEAMMLQLLAALQFDAGNYRGAFSTVREAAEAHFEVEEIGKLTERAQEVFADLYLNGGADELSPVEALTLFYSYRHLTPAGARGDEMIRNLARRLVDVDLLEQAANLLEYQVDNRLGGAARAQIAADLAIIHIADRAPEKALNALNRTNISSIAPSLERQRRILEARALIDAGRAQLALDVLRSMDGRDAEVLRVEAYWRDRQYRDAAEQIELIYSTNGVPGTLGQIGRRQLLKGAVGFVLANDQIGLARFRAKFTPVVEQSPEWPLFDYVSGLVSQNSRDFRALAAEIASTDSLAAFLMTYRETYANDGALTPATAVSSS